MKKLLVLLAVTFLLSLSVPAFAAIGINVNGQDVYSDVPAQNIGGRVMVPVRLIAEMFGANVSWDEARQTVNIVWQPKQVISQQVQPQTYNDTDYEEEYAAAYEEELENARQYVIDMYESQRIVLQAQMDQEWKDYCKQYTKNSQTAPDKNSWSYRELQKEYDPYFKSLEVQRDAELNRIR